MPEVNYKNALIVGVGSGLSASLARLFAKSGMKVAIAARRLDNISALAKEVGGKAFSCDATDRGHVAKLFADVEAAQGAPDVVVYNASYRTRGPFIDLDPAEVERSVAVTAFGAFLVAQEAAKRMVPKAHGAIMLTGASAGVKGYPQSAPFAMGKFAVRGLAQSLARELGPQGIHVVHFVIDGGVVQGSQALDVLSPRAIARSYMAALAQPSGAWSWELELRSHTEPF